ncbi:MAG TPA: zf-HC2 domain-containing protein [Terriglobia bacterium]|nr:zf-HC2 domain-containing protein [Terriglobia bacterium]
MSTSECSAAQKLMSPFIDSMVSPEEAERMEFHVSNCMPCQRQLQSLISMRSLLARIDSPELPEDLVLETRVKLSHERNKNVLVRLENRLGIILKPIAIPALFGVSLTMLFFGVLLGGLATNQTVLAQSGIVEQPVFGLYKPVRTTEPTMIRFAVDKNSWTEPLMIETHVGDDGKVIDYRIISGQETPEVNRWVREMLSLAAFTPATAFGRPVESKIILSFVAVRS